MHKNGMRVTLPVGMRASLFRMGLGLVIAGTVWISLVFAGAERTQAAVHLAQSDALETKLRLAGGGIGYFSVHMPGFSGQTAVFVHVLDPGGNVIREEVLQTRMAVGYFDFEGDGTYTVRAANVSDHAAELRMEAGDTASRGMVPAGILILAGSVTVMFASYVRMRNYSMTQPDENIS